MEKFTKSPVALLASDGSDSEAEKIFHLTKPISNFHLVNDVYSKIEAYPDTPLQTKVILQEALNKNIMEEDDNKIFYESDGDLGGAIRYFIDLLGLTLTTVAERADIQTSYLSMIIQNKRIPHIKKLSAIARALNGLPLAHLFLKAKLLDIKKNIATANKNEKIGLSLEPYLESMIAQVYGISEFSETS